MSLFQDDFYSTKVSRWKQRGLQAPAARAGNQLFWIIAGAMLVGMSFMLLLVLVVGGFSGGAGEAAEDSQRTELELVESGITGREPYSEDRIVAAAAKVRPAVVSVLSTFKDGDKITATSMGSGIIFEKTGGKARVVTNNHVVDGGASYEVVMSGGQRKSAKVLGKDRITDLAVLEMDAGGVQEVAVFGDSDKLQWGETAISIGNPLGLNYGQTVTVGVISSPKVLLPSLVDEMGGVEWEMDLIQTDSAINQGNSGGALVSLEGKVIGINSMKLADTGLEGLGFAIPINDAKTVIAALIQDQRVRRPYIGVSTLELAGFAEGTEALKLPTDVKNGAVVMEVQGPARNAGLKTNDVIVEMDGRSIDGTLSLRKYLYNEKKIGEKLKITYYRAGKKDSVTLVLEELKDSK
ncbi:MAG: serine protease [Paenibacillaceae bacterium]|jgi:serine protease Do|nr:serine protease [Paenibacillaceae bacterium]